MKLSYVASHALSLLETVVLVLLLHGVYIYMYFFFGNWLFSSLGIVIIISVIIIIIRCKCDNNNNNGGVSLLSGLSLCRGRATVLQIGMQAMIHRGGHCNSRRQRGVFYIVGALIKWQCTLCRHSCRDELPCQVVGSSSFNSSHVVFFRFPSSRHSPSSAVVGIIIIIIIITTSNRGGQ